MSDVISVSFIIPAYQAGATIERCVNSVLRIRSFNYEVIVVNDGSTDNTRELVEKIASRHEEVKLINQSNCGRSSARNKGIDASCGHWMMFIDADDYLLNDAGKVIAKHLDSRSDLVMFAYEASKNPKDSTHKGSLAPMDFINLVIDPTSYESAGMTLEESNRYWYRTPYMRLFKRIHGDVAAPQFPEGLRFGEDAIYNIEYVLTYISSIELEPEPIYYVDDSTPGTIRSFSITDVKAVAHYAECANELLLGRVDDQKLSCFIGSEWHRLLWRAVRYGNIHDLDGCLDGVNTSRTMGEAHFVYPSERLLCRTYNLTLRIVNNSRIAARAVAVAQGVLNVLKRVKNIACKAG